MRTAMQRGKPLNDIPKEKEHDSIRALSLLFYSLNYPRSHFRIFNGKRLEVHEKPQKVF